MATQAQSVGLNSLQIVTLVVEDQDDAFDWYTEVLGFEGRQDEAFEIGSDAGRWLTIGLPGDEIEIALVEADEPYYDETTRDELVSKRGTSTWWTFTTDDCRATIEAMESAGVTVVEPPQDRPWGTEAMVADPDGNQFSVFESAS